MTAASIARLKITLDDIKPVVLRRVEVPTLLRLDRLHLVIQSAMPGVVYPRLIEAGCSPPENVAALSAMPNSSMLSTTPSTKGMPNSNSGSDTTSILTIVDTDALAEGVTALAKLWSRRPATRRPRPT